MKWLRCTLITNVGISGAHREYAPRLGPPPLDPAVSIIAFHPENPALTSLRFAESWLDSWSNRDHSRVHASVQRHCGVGIFASAREERRPRPASGHHERAPSRPSNRRTRSPADHGFAACHLLAAWRGW